MKWRFKLFILMGALVVLTSCGTKESHSLQFGNVSNEGNVIIKKTLSNKKVFDRSEELMADARNIFLDEKELDHKSTFYLQLTNERQDIVIANYYLWDDSKRERFISRSFFDEKRLYYEITGHDYRMLKKQIALIGASDEPLRKKASATVQPKGPSSND